MIVYYSEYSMFVVGDYVPKWLPKWASQLKIIISNLRLRDGNFPFQNRKGCELGLYNAKVRKEPSALDSTSWTTQVSAVNTYRLYDI